MSSNRQCLHPFKKCSTKKRFSPWSPLLQTRSQYLFFDLSSQKVMTYTDYCYFVKIVISPFAAMAPSKKVLATVSRGQLPSFCRIGTGGCNNFALGFTGGSWGWRIIIVRENYQIFQPSLNNNIILIFKFERSKSSNCNYTNTGELILSDPVEVVFKLEIASGSKSEREFFESQWRIILNWCHTIVQLHVCFVNFWGIFKQNRPDNTIQYSLTIQVTVNSLFLGQDQKFLWFLHIPLLSHG